MALYRPIAALVKDKGYSSNLIQQLIDHFKQTSGDIDLSGTKLLKSDDSQINAIVKNHSTVLYYYLALEQLYFPPPPQGVNSLSEELFGDQMPKIVMIKLLWYMMIVWLKREGVQNSSLDSVQKVLPIVNMNANEWQTFSYLLSGSALVNLSYWIKLWLIPILKIQVELCCKAIPVLEPLVKGNSRLSGMLDRVSAVEEELCGSTADGESGSVYNIAKGIEMIYFTGAIIKQLQLLVPKQVSAISEELEKELEVENNGVDVTQVDAVFKELVGHKINPVLLEQINKLIQLRDIGAAVANATVFVLVVGIYNTIQRFLLDIVSNVEADPVLNNKNGKITLLPQFSVNDVKAMPNVSSSTLQVGGDSVEVDSMIGRVQDQLDRLKEEKDGADAAQQITSLTKMFNTVEVMKAFLSSIIQRNGESISSVRKFVMVSSEPTIYAMSDGGNVIPCFTDRGNNLMKLEGDLSYPQFPPIQVDQSEKQTPYAQYQSGSEDGEQININSGAVFRSVDVELKSPAELGATISDKYNTAVDARRLSLDRGIPTNAQIEVLLQKGENNSEFKIIVNVNGEERHLLDMHFSNDLPTPPPYGKQDLTKRSMLLSRCGMPIGAVSAVTGMQVADSVDVGGGTITTVDRNGFVLELYRPVGEVLESGIGVLLMPLYDALSSVTFAKTFGQIAKGLKRALIQVFKQGNATDVHQIKQSEVGKLSSCPPDILELQEGIVKRLLNKQGNSVIASAPIKSLPSIKSDPDSVGIDNISPSVSTLV